MKHVYFVRHGQTRYNVEERVQPTDSELDEIGLIQAEKIADRVANLGVTKIISSDFKRAMQTADAIVAKCNKTYEISPLFHEVLTPSSLVEMERSSPEHQAYMDAFREHSNEPSWHFEDEENMFDVFERSRKGMEFLASQEAETLLVVSHGLFLRYFLSYVLFCDALSPELHQRFRRTIQHSNVGLSLFTIDDEGIWRMMLWNDHAHLG